MTSRHAHRGFTCVSQEDYRDSMPHAKAIALINIAFAINYDEINTHLWISCVSDFASACRQANE